MGLKRVWKLIRSLRVDRDDELSCMVHALQERCEELEARVSFLEDRIGNDGELIPLGEGEFEGLAVLDGEAEDWEGEIHFRGDHAESDWKDKIGADEAADNEYSAVRSPRKEENDEDDDLEIDGQELFGTYRGIGDADAR